jgi:SAM-dependent methyltransferase
VVSHYAQEFDLWPAERELFGRHLVPGMSILDLGVGGGRTTAFLAQLAGRYVGVDISEAMVQACAAKYPHERFEVCDASDLERFPDENFDAVVFSFNGIDYIRPEGRSRCLSEVARVLVDGGKFIFSSHNARHLAVAPRLRGASMFRRFLRTGKATLRSIPLAARTFRSGCYLPGQGYTWDPAHGGIWTYVSTPATMKPQLSVAGFEIVDVISGAVPDPKPMWFTPFYHYACHRASQS